MEKMRKITVLLLALVLVVSLAGCGLKPELLGTYETEIDLCDSVITNFDKSAGLSDSAFSLKNHLTDFNLVLRFTFHEDGSYQAFVDRDCLQTAVDNLKIAVTALIDDYLFTALQQQYSNYGLTLENRADMEDLVNTTWENLYVSVLGMSLNEYVDNMISDSFTDVLTAEYCSEGRYIAQKGMLHLSESLTAEPSEEIYECYQISGNTVTFTESVNMEANTLISYPYTLTKIS